MKFVLLKASDPSFERVVEVNTMEDLVDEYVCAYRCAMIVNKDGKYNYPTITIYDDYIE